MFKKLIELIEDIIYADDYLDTVHRYKIEIITLNGDVIVGYTTYFHSEVVCDFSEYIISQNQGIFLNGIYTPARKIKKSRAIPVDSQIVLCRNMSEFLGKSSIRDVAKNQDKYKKRINRLLSKNK